MENHVQDEMVAPYNVQLYTVSAGKRFANLLIDTVMYYILVIIGGMLMGIIIAVVAPDELAQFDDDRGTWWIYLLAITVNLGYYTLMESVFGRTVGKLITGTKVVDREGKLPSTGTIFKRSLSRLVPFEAFSFLGAGARGWHDEWTDTWVVDIRDRGIPPV